MSVQELIHNPLLSNFTVKKGFGGDTVGTNIAPINEINSLNATYFKMKRTKSGSGAGSTQRAPGDKVKESQLSGKELVVERLTDHAEGGVIPIEFSEGSGMTEPEILQEKKNKAEELVLQIKSDHEDEVFNMAWADSVGDFSTKFPGQTITPSTKWNAGGPIKRLFLQARVKMLEQSGFVPNVAVVPHDVYDVITTEANELREVVKYTNQSGDPVTLRHVASYLEVDRVVVPEFLADANSQGSSESKALKWKGDVVGLFYANDRMGRNINSYAKTFTTGMRGVPFLGVETGFDSKRKSDYVQVSAYWKIAQIDTQCAVYLTDVLS